MVPKSQCQEGHDKLIGWDVVPLGSPFTIAVHLTPGSSVVRSQCFFKPLQSFIPDAADASKRSLEISTCHTTHKG
ncbi:hypothetical protein CEXT_693221 [Caerostris extrusa]|uniref:Uncharacterized protein n=1 Tax=Caerostris extrusa TaxID=172846 RepID=A0AAV4T3T3_CAEEX|nr:hypothetical protein CEXT_693221 [Caerostris extrusa]